jgi:hypothetical protein
MCFTLSLICLYDLGHLCGYGKCTFTKRDARNHIDKYRREKASQVQGGREFLVNDRKHYPSLSFISLVEWNVSGASGTLVKRAQKAEQKELSEASTRAELMKFNEPIPWKLLDSDLFFTFLAFVTNLFMYDLVDSPSICLIPKRLPQSSSGEVKDRSLRFLQL